MRACVASDCSLSQAVCHLCDWVLVALHVTAALASWSSARIAAAGASLTAFELVTEFVGAANRTCRHAHGPAALLVSLARDAHVVVFARLAVPLLHELGHYLARKTQGVRRRLLDHDLVFAAASAHCPGGWARSGIGDRVLATIYVAAVASGCSTGVATAGAACAARKAVTIAIVAAHSALAYTHIAAACGVDAANEVGAVLVCALHAELILAHGFLGHRILVPVDIRAALAPCTCTSVPTAGAKFATLKVDSMGVLTAFGRTGSAESSTACVVSRAQEFIRVVGASLEYAFRD